MLPPPGLSLPIHGKGAYISWVDRTPTPSAGSPLDLALASVIGASSSLASWCSTPKRSDDARSSWHLDVLRLSSCGNEEHARIRTKTNHEKKGDDHGSASQMERAVSAVASVGLISWRIARPFRRSNVLEPQAVIGGKQSASSNDPHSDPPSQIPSQSLSSVLHLNNGDVQEGASADGLKTSNLDHADTWIDDFFPPQQDAIAEACIGSKGVEAKCDDACENQQVSNSKTLFVSEGSRLHDLGKCRPCSWFWKPQGCQFGAECQHCHVCDGSEQKRRKAEKVKALRAAGVPKRLPKHRETSQV